MTANELKFENLKFNDVGNITTLKLTGGSFYLPKDKREKPQGDDAHFVCNVKNTIGVADGVGGWASRGVDAGKYAGELMENCFTALLDQNKGSIKPLSVLQWAYRNTSSKGSSTACIIALNDNNVLRYANIGDSGFALFRENKLFYRSPIQQHKFNHPYQLGGGSTNTPNMAYEEEIRVEEGDIIVAATDGLFDNVYPEEIEKILDRNKDDDSNNLALKIIECAQIHSVDRTYNSPFAKAAKLAKHIHEGGKKDDITVVVAKIERDSATSSSI